MVGSKIFTLQRKTPYYASRAGRGTRHPLLALIQGVLRFRDLLTYAVLRPQALVRAPKSGKEARVVV